MILCADGLAASAHRYKCRAGRFSFSAPGTDSINFATLFLSNLGVSVGRAGLLFEVLLSDKLSSGVQGIER